MSLILYSYLLPPADPPLRLYPPPPDDPLLLLIPLLPDPNPEERLTDELLLLL